MEMDRSVLRSEPVKKAIERFVPVRLNGNREVDLSLRYRILSSPTFLVLTPQGDVLARREGFVPVEEFVSFLRGAAAPGDGGSGSAASSSAVP